MKITIKQNLIVDALKNISAIVASNTGRINFSLSCVLMEATNKKLILTATNTNISYNQIIEDVEIEEEGKILITAKLIYNILKNTKQEKITLNQVEQNILLIKTPTSSSQINLIEDESYPIINFDHSNWNKIQLEYDIVKNLNDHILPFVCNQNTSTYSTINGVFFSVLNDKEIEAIATDMYRMSYYRFNYIGTTKSFILTKETIKYALDLMNNYNAKTIDLYLNDKKCILNLNNSFLLFNLYQDRFPIGPDKILTSQKHNFTIKTSDIINALEKGNGFVANEEKPIVQIRLEDNLVKLTFNSNEIGTYLEEITTEENNCKENFEFKLNLNFLWDTLKTIKSSKVTFNFNSSNSGIILSTDNKFFLSLILPYKN